MDNNNNNSNIVVLIKGNKFKECSNFIIELKSKGISIIVDQNIRRVCSE